MEDEACTTYSANIDQMTEGHQFIVSLFGESAAPKYGWQIDPFGHSNTVHEQFGLMGFEATVLDRIQYTLKSELTANHSLEMIWQTNDNLGASSQIFTHIMDQFMYTTAVQGIEFDAGDPPVDDLNIDLLASRIIDNIKLRYSYGQTSNVLFPWGTDFQHYFMVDDMNNFDLLVDYINKKTNETGVRVQYSTLSDYFNAVANESVAWNNWPATDFFPYDDQNEAWWTGYFTSRNALKGYTRSRENILRVAELGNVLSQTPWGALPTAADNYARLEVMRQKSGEATHHDAVSGTAEPYVVIMYEEDLGNGTAQVTPLIEDTIASLGQSSAESVPVMTVDASTMSGLLDGSTNVAINVFNPTSWQLTTFVDVPAFQTNLIVTDHTGAAVPYDVLPTFSSANGPCQVPGVCGHANVSSPYTLHIGVTLPALGSSVYFVSVNASAEPNAATYTTSSITTVTNGALELVFDPSYHLLTNVNNIALGISAAVEHNFYEYDSLGNIPIGKKVTEGPYIFHPNGPAEELVSSPYFYEVVQGKFVTEVRQRFTVPCNDSNHMSCGVEHVYRMHASADEAMQYSVELYTSVGPLMVNKDFISGWTTSLLTNNMFYTDDNCFDTHTRVYNPNLNNSIGGNYYPLTCAGFIRDILHDSQLTFLTDRTHGGSSQGSGQFEIMYHRRTISTDLRGFLNLDDQDNLQNIHTTMLFADIATSTRLRRQIQYNVQFPPTLLFAATSYLADSWPYAGNYSALLQPLPLNVHLLSLLQLNQTFSQVVLRLAHIFEVEDNSPLSQPVSFALADYIGFASIDGMNERTLTTVHPVSYLAESTSRFTGRRNTMIDDLVAPSASNNYTVTLQPTQIRTFFVQFGAN